MGYFREILPRHDLSQLYVKLVRAELIARQRGDLLMASRFQRAVRDLQAGYVKVAEEIAAYADERARHWIKKTAKRPLDSPGSTSQRMANAVQSKPLPVRAVPGGAVGIADVDALGEATMRRGANEPYWRAQEYGYEGNVGRVIPGYFSHSASGGPYSRAGQDPWRTHPYFQVIGGAPRMTITEPIEARHFLEKASTDAFRQWQKKVALMEVRALERIGPPRPRV